MRLRKGSKWLLLAALVASASVLLEHLPGIEATSSQKGSKKRANGSLNPSSLSSRTKYSRTKGNTSKKHIRNSANSSNSSTSTSTSASTELGDKVIGVIQGFGTSANSPHYSKVFKKGSGVVGTGGSGKGSGGGKKGGKGTKKGNKLTIVTPSLITTTEKIVTVTQPTTENTIEKLTTSLPVTTKRQRTRVSFGLGHESGMHTSSWVGIDKLGSQSQQVELDGVIGLDGALGQGLSGGLGDLNDFFVGATKDYRPLERGGLYADGLDLDFAKVYPEYATELPMMPTSSNTNNGFNPVIVGTSSLNVPSNSIPQHNLPSPSSNYETFLMKDRMEDLEKKVLDMERTIATMQRNIEVLQQNTQVISKGFNILSGRVNKVTGDYELVNAKVDDYKKSLEEKIVATEENVSLALIALQLKTTGELVEIKKNSLEALGNATILVNATQARRPDEKPIIFESLVQNMTMQMEEWQKTAKNETQLVAEMVKALAEISQGEKQKLENLSNYSRKEIERLGDMLEKQSVEHSHEWDALSTKLKVLKLELEERDKKFSSDILDVHQGLRNATKHFEHEVKQVEESLLEQNMAHNMAHENIALKIDEISVGLEKQQQQHNTIAIDPIQLRRLSGAEANITTLFAANKQFLQQFSSLEEMNGLILSKIADLRTVHKNDNATTRKDLFEFQRVVGKMEHDNRVILDRLRDIQDRVDKARQDMIERMDVGRLGLEVSDLMDTQTPKPTEVGVVMQVEIGEMRDRMVTFEENVAELWRGHKQFKDMMEHSEDMVRALQTAHLADHEDVSLQIMEIKIASKMLSEVVRNLSRNVNDFLSEQGQKLMTKKKQQHDENDYTNGLYNFSSRLGELDDNSTRLENSSLEGKPTTSSSLGGCRNLEEDVNGLWELSRNISKAQELFLVKLLEMDMEHEKDNRTVRQMLMFVMNRTEDFNLQFLTADERINKILQQFEFTDAEQAKMREELFNIKDRLAATEENSNALWKATRHLEKAHDEIQNNIENTILVHKTEAKNVTSDIAQTKQKIEMMSAGIAGVMDRVINLELIMDMEASKERHSEGRIADGHTITTNSTELSRIKSRLASTERDVQELWKSSEILSFQQQVFNDKMREIQNTHENDTMAATVERMQNQLEAQNLSSLVKNMTLRLQTVEKYTSPPYESKTIEFEIKNWNDALTSGLKNQQVVYENGRLLDLPSTWRTFVERSGNFISLYNSLLKAEKPVYNELTVEILDSDGKVYSTYGPDMHLYKTNEKIGWASMISMSALQNPTNNLVTNDSLRFRLRTKLYPHAKEEEDAELPQNPSEKQLIVWEMSNLADKLRTQIDEDQAFVDLQISKEFQAGHFWGGHTTWKTSLLMREIHSQNYLGINMELLHVDQNWRELIASYNVTLLDGHDRIVKEFAIASNDFKAVSARHSYFMLVNDVLQVLDRGDKLTIKIFFDLKARKRSFDVEFIKTK